MKIFPDENKRLEFPTGSEHDTSPWLACYSDLRAWLSCYGERVSKSKILDFNFVKYNECLPVIVPDNEAPFICINRKDLIEQLARLENIERDYFVCRKEDLKKVCKYLREEN
jgi:hypothetical protein